MRRLEKDRPWKRLDRLVVRWNSLPLARGRPVIGLPLRMGLPSLVRQLLFEGVWSDGDTLWPADAD